MGSCLESLPPDVIQSTFELEKEKSDVTIVCKGKRMRAHSILLADYSKIFSEIFQIYPQETYLINLENFNPVIIKSILKYMYSGRLLTSDKDLPELTKTLDQLEMPNVKSNVVPQIDFSTKKELHLKGFRTIIPEIAEGREWNEPQATLDELVSSILCEKKREFKCIICHCIYQRRNAARSHVEAKHLPGSYPCLGCSDNRIFTSLRYLQAHKKTYHEFGRMGL